MNEMMREMDDICMDKVEGCLWGLALGDALGVPFERKTRREICDPEGGISIDGFGQRDADADERRQRFDPTYDEPLPDPWKRGSVSDDTSMSLALIDAVFQWRRDCRINTSARVAYLMRSGPPALTPYVANAFKMWLLEDGRGAGRHTREVITDPGFLAAPLDASLRIWLRKDRRCGNGAVMRAPATGLLPVEFDRMAAITHYDPIAISASVFVSSLVGSLVRRPPASRTSQEDLDFQGSVMGPIDIAWIIAVDSIEKLAHGKQDVTQKHIDLKHVEYVKAQLDVRKPYVEAYSLGLDREPMFTSAKTLRAAIWALSRVDNSDWLSVVKAVIEAGGDTDTNAAVAGAVCGAHLGITAMKQDENLQKLLEELDDQDHMSVCNALHQIDTMREWSALEVAEGSGR